MRKALLILLLCLPAHAEPPDGADPSLHEFYRSLKVPDNPGASCCDMSDCRPVVTRIKDGKLQAFIGLQFPNTPNEWRDIPDDAVIHGKANEAGRPILCWTGVVLCFLDGGAV
jgi:hypothetical protein